LIVNPARERACDEAIISYDSVQVTPGGRDNDAALSAFIANGFRLSFSVSTNPITVAGVGFGGSDLSVATGISPDSTATEVVDTGLDNVDLVIVMNGGRVFNFDAACGSTTASTIGFGIGFCAQTQAGAIQQASVFKTNNSSCRIASDRVCENHSVVTPGAPSRAARVTDITGGRITFDSVGAVSYDVGDFAWMAFDFGGQALATVQVVNSDRSSSTTSVDLDMIPLWAAVIGTQLSALDTTVTTPDASPLSFGMIDTGGQNVAAVESVDGTVPGTPHTYTNTGEIWAAMAEGAASFSQRATGSFSGTNLSLSFTDHDTTADRYGIVVAIGSPGDLAVDEQVEVQDEANLLLTGLEGTPQDTVVVTDSVDLVLTDVELELEPNQKPKGTARAGPDASQAYGG
jgi:hypothetical protein